MSAQSSYKPSGMVQSMKVKVSTFTQQFSQTEINNLRLGKNNQVRLTNQAMINRIRNSNLSSLTPSIVINTKYTQLINQSSSADVSLPSSYLYGTSAVLIDPGNGSNLGMYTKNAYLYSDTYLGVSFQTIANTIINTAYISVNSSLWPAPNTLTQNITWLPEGWDLSGSSYWYNLSAYTDDFIAQQIIVYAAMYSYINTVIQGNPVNSQMIITLYTNGLDNDFTPADYIPSGPPWNVGNISFSTAWPFQLNNLSVNTVVDNDSFGTMAYTNVPYDPNGLNLPPGLSGVTTLDENDMLNLFQINMPIVIGSNSSQVNNYSSNPTGIVSLTESSNAILMNFIATGTTTVTINNVSFNVTIPSVPINFSSWQEYPPYGDNSGYPMFTSTQMWQIPQETVTFGQWYLNIYTPNFTPSLPYAYQNAITMVFTSSNTNLPIVDFNDNNPMTATNNVSDLAGQYVSAGLDLGNNGQTSTITATAYLFGQIIPNASYTYTYTFTLPNWSPYHYPHL